MSLYAIYSLFAIYMGINNKIIGTLTAKSGPNSTVIPYCLAYIYKTGDGLIYIDDPWFGKVSLPDSIKSEDVIETRSGRYGCVYIGDIGLK